MTEPTPAPDATATREPATPPPQQPADPRADGGGGLSRADERDNWKTAYAEFGNWARHYSAIRATLTTALVTISAALLYYGVDKRLLVLKLLALLVCALAIWLLREFTKLTLDRYDKQLRYAQKLGILEHEIKPHDLRNDQGFLAGLFFGVVYLAFVVALIFWPPEPSPQEMILRDAKQPVPVRPEPPTTTMPKLP